MCSAPRLQMEALLASSSLTGLRTLFSGYVHDELTVLSSKVPSVIPLSYSSTVAVSQRSYRRSIKTELRATGRNRKSGGIGSGTRRRGTPRKDKLQAEADTTLQFLEPHVRIPKEDGHEKSQQEEDEEDALAEAALEALFAQLEKDLEDGATSKEGDDDDVDFTEEEIMALENELESALLGRDYTQQDTKASESEPGASARKAQEDVEILLDGEGEDEEEQRVVSLETWQLKKLAAAAEVGRRHVNVKALAAELGMERSDVLSWLKDPPPELLMLGASMGLEEEVDDADQVEDFEVVGGRNSSKDSSSSDKGSSAAQELAPLTWHSQKRLRKEHIATFERVFRRTRRPTNAMIQNLVELTHVPRKRVVEWFEQKRQEVEPSRSFESLR